MPQAAADPLMMPLPLALGLGLGCGSDNSVHKAMLTITMQCTCFLLTLSRHLVKQQLVISKTKLVFAVNGSC